MAHRDLVVFEAAARDIGFLGFGFYPRSAFIHVGLGPGEAVGQARTVRNQDAAGARGYRPEPHREGRRGAAGVATLGAAGVEVAQSVLAETQTAILPVVPYLDTLRWVFIAVALGGIAVTIYARLDH